MDLKESSFSGDQRHPWELARAATIARILSRVVHQKHCSEAPKVLDFGSGDSYLVHKICQNLPDETHITCVDSSYSNEQIILLRDRYPSSDFQRELPSGQFDFIFALDVLEHINNDLSALKEVSEHLPKHGVMFITVPAFQCLYTERDRFLQHFRRYRHSQLKSLLVNAEMKIDNSGYFFASLLAPRAVNKGMRIVLKATSNAVAKKTSVARPWRRTGRLAQLFAFLWVCENRILAWVAAHYVRIPGLTVWAVCTKK